MRKFLSALLVAVFLFGCLGLTGCKNKTGNTTENNLTENDFNNYFSFDK